MRTGRGPGVPSHLRSTLMPCGPGATALGPRGLWASGAQAEPLLHVTYLTFLNALPFTLL